MEKSKEHKERLKIREKEAGFNIHFNGANEERIQNQRKQELLRGNSGARGQSNNNDQSYDYNIGVGASQNMQNQKVRRMWKNPNSGESDGQQPMGDQKYTNPFDLGPPLDKKSNMPMPITGQQSPPKIRKRWGNKDDRGIQGIGGVGKPTKAIHDYNSKDGGNDDEEQYSDSFEEEIPQDFEDDYGQNDNKNQRQSKSQGLTRNDLSEIQDNYGEDDNDDQDFDKYQKKNQELQKKLNKQDDEEENDNGKNEIEQFLKTATMNDINALRQSMSNFGELTKQYNPKREVKVDDEDYIEEEFEEQIESDDEKNSQEEEREEPISAVYNLEAQKIQTQRTQVNPDPYNSNYSQPGKFESKPLGGGIQSNYGTNQQSLQFNSQIQETPKQPNDNMKKPVNSNPFKRPFSQNRIELLDDWQKEKLMEILENIDTLGSSQISQSSKKPEPQQQQQKQIQSQVKNLDFNFLSPQKVNVNQSSIFTNPDKKEIILRVVKTYGNPHLCGLTEIELFDQHAKKIVLAPAHIIPKNLGQGPKIPIARLCDGFKLTNEEKHMWIGYLPLHPQQLELVLQIDKNQEIGGLKIWNYNKSALDCTKGIKQLQILINGETVWEGIIESGKGSTTTEYATFIELKEGINLPREIQPKPIIQESIQEVYEEEESKDMIKQNDFIHDDQDDFMKKYKSVAQFQQQNKDQKSQGSAGGPIWMSGSQQTQRINQQNTNQNQAQSDQRPKDKPESQPFNTFDLLDKYQFNQQVKSDSTSANSGQSHQKSQSQSAVGSSRPHPLRGNQLQSQSTAQIKPNVGQASQVQSTRSKQQVDLNTADQLSGNANKQWTQPFQAPKQNLFGANIGSAMQETSDAIQKAVSKVNQVMTNQQNLNKNKNQVVEESLDNLDFFKATNRGRLMNFNDEDSKKQELQKPARKQWGVSPGKSNNSSRLQESQLSGSKHSHKSHVVVKNPFPEKESQNIKNNTRKLQKDEGADYLDQILNNDMKSSNYQNKIAQQIPDPVHHLQFAGNLGQSNQNSKKNSISPARDQDIQLQHPGKTYIDKLMDFSKPFMIPNLPSGSKLEFNILQTWGDMNYVGLAGIEIFNIEGRPLKIQPHQISAYPPDINILQGYGGDPRTIDKLVDEHHLTTDDCHVWLTPFTAGEDHTISIDLGGKEQISMIRIWNYNKSRIHSYRGARLVECQLDSKMIFRGEIQKAPGNVNDPENCCEIILFTNNDSILQRIDNNDWINQQVIKSDMENTQRILQEVPNFNDERPMTATKKFSTTEIQEIQRQLKQQKPTSIFDERPQTSAIITSDQEEAKQKPSSLRDRFDTKHQELSAHVRQMAGISQPIKGRMIEINIIESWGDLFYVGLTGIEIWDENGIPMILTKQMLDANPRDMNSIQGHGSDYRTLDKLINNINITMDDHNMWLIPFNKGENHTLKIDLGKVKTISAIKFYNYNKSEEDTLRGAKQITIQLDKKFLTPKKGITIRKGPGLIHPLFDMGHLIKLPYKIGWTTEQMIPIQRPLGQLGLFQEYDLVNLPMGFQFMINLYSTHGDFYYIGLNGIELFDQFGSLIKVSNIFAEPLGVNKLAGMESDVRIIQNLFNGKNQTIEESNMWLAPFKNTRSYQAVTKASAKQDQEDTEHEYRIPNYICIVFDQPTVISAMTLWNYAKTPSRGVNEFELLVDGKQVYRGFAKPAPDQKSQQNQDFSTSVLFTSESKIVDRLKQGINYDSAKQQDVALFNEKKQMNKNSTKVRRPEEEFVFSEMQRPTTMARR
eukprot:403338590